MNPFGRVKNTLPVRFITLYFASLGILIQKSYEVEIMAKWSNSINRTNFSVLYPRLAFH